MLVVSSSAFAPNFPDFPPQTQSGLLVATACSVNMPWPNLHIHSLAHMYICTHVHIHIHIHIDISVYIYIHIQMYIHICAHNNACMLL